MTATRLWAEQQHGDSAGATGDRHAGARATSQRTSSTAP